MPPADHSNIEAMHTRGWSLIDSGQVTTRFDGRANAASRRRARTMRGLCGCGFARLLLGNLKQGGRITNRAGTSPAGRRRRAISPPAMARAGYRGQNHLPLSRAGAGRFDSVCAVCAALVRQLGANVLLATPPELESLFERSFPDVRLVRSGQPIPAFQFHCPLMSLPLALGTTLDTIPSMCRISIADSFSSRRNGNNDWRFSDGLKVGLVWAGGPLSIQNVNALDAPVADERLGGRSRREFCQSSKRRTGRRSSTACPSWTARFHR